MLRTFKVDVSRIGLDEMREYPELVPACGGCLVLPLTHRMGLSPRHDQYSSLPHQVELPIGSEAALTLPTYHYRIPIIVITFHCRLLPLPHMHVVDLPGDYV